MEDDADSRELMEERAAIMEYDGGLTRPNAEHYAMVTTYHYCQRTGREPPRTDLFRTMSHYFSIDTPREPGEKSSGYVTYRKPMDFSPEYDDD